MRILGILIILISLAGCGSIGEAVPSPEHPQAACRVTRGRGGFLYERVFIVGEYDAKRWMIRFPDVPERMDVPVDKKEISKTRCPSGFLMGIPMPTGPDVGRAPNLR